MGGFLPPAERRSGALIGTYAALALLLLIVGDRIPQAALRGIGAYLFAPFDRAVLVVDRVNAAWRENEELHVRITRLELENQRLRAAGIENERLRGVLGLPPFRGVTLKPVEVLALNGEPIPSAATVSAGAQQGVRTGDAVVTRDGLIGRIAETYPGLARVALLTDARLAVACEVESTGVLGVLRFDTDPHPRLTLTGVPVADTVRVGQRVVTSGLSRLFPRGLPVGSIATVAVAPSGLTQDLEVHAHARLSRLRHAFVLPLPPDPARESR
jgi:rod shape-determining protein MreC